MKHLILILLFLGTNDLYGQQLLNTFQIDSITKSIDLICVRSGISDGIIKDPESNQTIGGFSDWYYTDSTHKNLLKVVYEQSLNSDSFTSFYFYNQNLIFILIKKFTAENENQKKATVGKYYIQNKDLIYKEEEDNFHFDLSYYLTTSKRYLKESNFWGNK